MTIRTNTPCDCDGICPYEAEYSHDCEWYCSAEEPQDSPEIWEEEAMEDWRPMFVEFIHEGRTVYEIMTICGKVRKIKIRECNTEEEAMAVANYFRVREE